jgi:hypothetical protein
MCGVVKSTTETSFKEEKGILRRGNTPVKGWRKW